jgi:hypothetical protein
MNQIPYFFSSNGAFGNTILVNGVREPYLEVSDRKYRFRILDASNVRVYDLALTTGDLFTQIGTDSGLLPEPVQRPQMIISPSERVDVVIDFAGRLGQTFYLRDERSGVDLLQFRVTEDVTDNSVVPPVLRDVPDLGEPVVTRNFTFSRVFGTWRINGQAFDPDRVDAEPALGSTEKWVFTSSVLDGGATHTVHVHGVDQQCISRNGAPCPDYETTKEAFFLSAGEILELKIKFTDHTGKFAFHCHMLEHEDDGMMAQYEVLGTSPTPTPGPSQTPTPTPTETPPPSTDSDGDGIADTVEGACGSDPQSESSVPERVDGVFATVDDDEDTQADEPLPGAAAGFDCDGDGYTGTQEGSIFTPSTNRDQDPCGADGWPANPFDAPGNVNRLDIQDVVSFVAIIRRLDTSPGDAGYNARWDLVPGPGGGGKHINLQDITALISGPTAFPPMFDSARAFERTCPWPG